MHQNVQNILKDDQVSEANSKKLQICVQTIKIIVSNLKESLSINLDSFVPRSEEKMLIGDVIMPIIEIFNEQATIQNVFILIEVEN
jgi:hypothetical protein